MLALVLATVACHTAGTPPMTAPDPACTPGAYTQLTRAQVCTHKIRPDLPTLERRRILIRYGVPAWSGHDGELDHRVPFFLGGATTARNIWPERGSIPNPKDRLEFYVHERVCRRYSMRVRTAVRLFLADWRTAYARYHARF